MAPDEMGTHWVSRTGSVIQTVKEIKRDMPKDDRREQQAAAQEREHDSVELSQSDSEEAQIVDKQSNASVKVDKTTGSEEVGQTINIVVK